MKSEDAEWNADPRTRGAHDCVLGLASRAAYRAAPTKGDTMRPEQMSDRYTMVGPGTPASGSVPMAATRAYVLVETAVGRARDIAAALRAAAIGIPRRRTLPTVFGMTFSRTRVGA